MTSLLAILATCIIGFLFETLKMEYIFHKVKVINANVEELIYEYTKDIDSVDVVMVGELKKIITAEYIKKHKMDNFLLYKKNLHEMRLEYKIGDALQIIDIYLNKLDHKLSEVSLNYDDDFVYPE